MALFEQAGFAHVSCRTIAAPMTLPTARHYVDFLRTSAGPIMALANRIAADRRPALWAEIERAYAAYASSDGWQGPNALLLAWGVTTADEGAANAGVST